MDYTILIGFALIGMNIFCTASPLYGPNLEIPPENAYPFIVSLQKKVAVDLLGMHKKFEHICGGSLVTRKHVVTAAHCLGKKLRTNKYRVIVGSIYLDSGQVHRVKTWLTYDKWAMLTYDWTEYPENDMAIVELAIAVDSKIKPAKITTASDDDLRDAKVVTAGWGDTGYDIKTRYMVRANLSMISHEQCRHNVEAARNFTKLYKMPPNFLCTNGEPYVILNCGDSGSPLFWKENEIIGINIGICPRRIDSFYTKMEQNVHIDLRFFTDFISDVTDECTIDESETASSCWPF